MGFLWIKLVFFCNVWRRVEMQKNSPWSGGYFFIGEWVTD